MNEDNGNEPSIRARVKIALDRAGGAAAELVSFSGLPGPSGEHIAVVFPSDSSEEPAYVRVHSECLTGDLLGSTRCDCGPQLQESVELFARRGGVLLYLRQEGRGIGLYNKLDAYVLQDSGLDTFEANRHLGRGEDERSYEAAAAMLRLLDVGPIRLVTNNPEKVRQLEEQGIAITERIGTGVFVTEANHRYLAVKAASAGHAIALSEEDQ
ncbi:GTP cyclohydrolase II [Haloglycomyces albus]|uniref:GTP cyclohydrolase II n=1 Tax=Haloglycomyces albus TaxID=526067 RepID=UPI00046D8427|nr:GTP cyclohydrolase II [Haloglycomyces albus]